MKGSSPLARGLLHPGNDRVDAGRIIPARAGFTFQLHLPCLTLKDHPRSRGVYRGSLGAGWAPPGSSPLARGLRIPIRQPRLECGIIPARAGFTCAGLLCSRSFWDHPRSRGVYRLQVGLKKRLEGSSPLARGLPAHYREHVDKIRIIPARAGFTATIVAGGSIYGGSSPLARGLREMLGGDHSDVRIIPARAGFTTRLGTKSSDIRDHPRSRGVYWSHTDFPNELAGSSPLARGLP